MPSLFQTQSWAIKLPDDWEPSEDGNMVVITPVGADDAALILSAYFKDSEISLSEMRDAIEGQTHDGSPVSEVQLGDFRGYGTNFTRREEDGDAAWRIWCLCSGDVHLYVSYNCSLGRRAKDDQAVDKMLKSLLCLTST